MTFNQMRWGTNPTPELGNQLGRLLLEPSNLYAISSATTLKVVRLTSQMTTPVITNDMLGTSGRGLRRCT
jgi:hypothetical protein